MTAKDNNTIKIGVIGTGMMGANHLRVYKELQNVELVGLCDPNPTTREKNARIYKCHAFQSYEEMIGQVNAVSICNPSIHHYECAKLMMTHGIHCLVEKPLATTPEHCMYLIQCSEDNNVKLLVGHIERFNPAVQQIFSLLQEGAKIQAIDARRLSAVSARIRDVDVAMDLMIHDLDIILALANSPVRKIKASQVRTETSSGGDYISALLSFENGITASVTASRISQNPVRRLTVTTDRGTVEVDYQNQSTEVYLQSSIIERDQHKNPFGQYASGITMENVRIRRQEPLLLELKHFIDIIQENKSPYVTGKQAKEALEIVWQIQDLIEE